MITSPLTIPPVISRTHYFLSITFQHNCSSLNEVMHYITQILIKSFLLLKGAALIPLLQVICLLALSPNDFLLDLTTRQVAITAYHIIYCIYFSVFLLNWFYPFSELNQLNVPSEKEQSRHKASSKYKSRILPF